jgi:hypothetical protein
MRHAFLRSELARLEGHLRVMHAAGGGAPLPLEGGAAARAGAGRRRRAAAAAYVRPREPPGPRGNLRGLLLCVPLAPLPPARRAPRTMPSAPIAAAVTAALSASPAAASQLFPGLREFAEAALPGWQAIADPRRPGAEALVPLAGAHPCVPLAPSGAAPPGWQPAVQEPAPPLPHDWEPPPLPPLPFEPPPPLPLEQPPQQAPPPQRTWQALPTLPPLPLQHEAAPGGGACGRGPAAPWGPPPEFVPGAEAAREVLAPLLALPPGALLRHPCVAAQNHRALRELCGVALLVGGARAVARVGARAGSPTACVCRDREGARPPARGVRASAPPRAGVPPRPGAGRARACAVRGGPAPPQDSAAAASAPHLLGPLPPLSPSGPTWKYAAATCWRATARSSTAARGSAPSRWSMCSRWPRRPPSGCRTRPTRGHGPWSGGSSSSAARRWAWSTWATGSRTSPPAL